MKNQLQTVASLYLTLDTDLDEEECDLKFNLEGFAAGNLFYVDSNERVHKFNIMNVLEFKKELFINNKKPLNGTSATPKELKQ